MVSSIGPCTCIRSKPTTWQACSTSLSLWRYKNTDFLNSLWNPCSQLPGLLQRDLPFAWCKRQNQCSPHQLQQLSGQLLEGQSANFNLCQSATSFTFSATLSAFMRAVPTRMPLKSGSQHARVCCCENSRLRDVNRFLFKIGRQFQASMKISLKGHQVAIIDPDDLGAPTGELPLVLSDYGSPPRPPGQDGSQTHRALQTSLDKAAKSTRSWSPLRRASNYLLFIHNEIFIEGGMRT